METQRVGKMSYETSIQDRIDSLNKDIYKKILQYRHNVSKKRYGLAEIKANEILELKSILRSNQDIGYHMFEMEPDEGYYTN